jgi:hypothetical protein
MVTSLNCPTPSSAASPKHSAIHPDGQSPDQIGDQIFNGYDALVLIVDKP